MSNLRLDERGNGRARLGLTQRNRTRAAGAITVLASGAALAATTLLASAPASAAAPAAPQAGVVRALVISRPAGPVRDVGSPMFVSVVPTVDIVGAGKIDCGAATGEVGYSPRISATGSKKVTEWVSIWFVATHCSPSKIKGRPVIGKPVPKTVIGSLAFKAILGTTCPQFGLLGKGYLHLAYNYPGVHNPMIDPSVGLVTITQSGPYWILNGPIFAGSYPTLAGPNFNAWIKPNLIGGHGCNNGGIDSEYIARAQAPFFRFI